MIQLQVQLHHFASKLLAKTVDAICYFLSYLPCQYPVTVLRCPKHVILTVSFGHSGVPDAQIRAELPATISRLSALTGVKLHSL